MEKYKNKKQGKNKKLQSEIVNCIILAYQLHILIFIQFEADSSFLLRALCTIIQ